MSRSGIAIGAFNGAMTIQLAHVLHDDDERNEREMSQMLEAMTPDEITTLVCDLTATLIVGVAKSAGTTPEQMAANWDSYAPVILAVFGEG